ncbi:MAG TPA: Rap1a/Tai family immunity protein, partial [Steroidobacter sp.]
YGMIPYFDCQSYVLAVLDTYRSMQGGKVCLPAQLTAREVLDVVTARFKYEKDGQRRASDVILEALQGKFVRAKPKQ